MNPDELLKRLEEQRTTYPEIYREVQTQIDNANLRISADTWTGVPIPNCRNDTHSLRIRRIMKVATLARALSNRPPYLTTMNAYESI